MQNLGNVITITGSGGAAGSGSAGVMAIYSPTPLGGILVGGEAIVVITTLEVTSMIDFLGGLSDGGYHLKYPTDFAF